MADRRGSTRRPKVQNAKRQKVTAVRPAVSVARVRSVGLVFLAVFGLFGYRLVDLQVTPDATLAESAGGRMRRVDLPATRGSFTDRHGRPLAVSRPSATVVADPRLVSDAQVPGVVAQLAAYLDTDPAVLTERLAGPAHYVYLQRQVDLETGDAIMGLDLPGVWLEQEPRREYPNGACSARALLGRVDIDHVGISGLELLHDEELTGLDGVSLAEVSRDGRLTIVGGDSVIHPPTPGEDIELSFDRDVQFKSEQLIEEAVRANGADWGLAIVSIPSTGELIALAGATRDDETDEVACTTENLTFTRAYEPGSTMKAITVASVLDAGLTVPMERIELEDSLTFPLDDGKTKSIKDWFPHTEDSYTTTDILGLSSNVGAATLAERLGPDQMYERFLDFGFGSTTGVGVPGETAGIIHPFTSTVALPTASYGQGVAVSPIQLTAAYNVLANDGRYIPPSLYLGGSSGPSRQVVSAETADQMLEMLRNVVEGEGTTGHRAAIPGYEVAGKTGTAWQACEGGGYENCEQDRLRHYTASFIGIVSNDLGPAFSVLVIIDNPRGEAYGGGAVAAPIFAEIASYTARQLRITPARSEELAAGPVRAPVSTLPAVDLNTADGQDGDADTPTEEG